jgi:hypothetical protein
MNPKLVKPFVLGAMAAYGFAAIVLIAAPRNSGCYRCYLSSAEMISTAVPGHAATSKLLVPKGSLRRVRPYPGTVRGLFPSPNYIQASGSP